MANLKNHPGFWLRDDAAAAFDAAEAKYGIFNVNSAGRTQQEQQNLINRWNAGGKYNRPPYLYSPAQPASSSNHVKDGGIAVDIANWDRFNDICGEFGFKWWGASDVVHFNFLGWSGGEVAFSQTVQNEQNWLRVSRGEHIQADGKKGPLTTDAYKRYQAFLRDWLYGYVGAIDGDWGPGTQKAHAGYYDAYNAARPNASRGHRGQYVKDIQARLVVAGFPTSVDGDFGPGTDNSVRNFQRSRNLIADGIVGINTRRALGL